MIALTFILECAAVAALVAGACSLVAFALSWGLRATRPVLSPNRRADLALLLSLAPAVATLAVLTATALPPVLSALGLGPADDCFSHDHHGHLCLVHLGAPRPALAVLGAAALALFVFRALLLVGKLLRASSDLAQLEALGQVQQSRFPIVWLPGGPRLCLAAGVLRRRILVSVSLAEQLEPAQLEAALAHERAHLQRRDPLVSILIQLGALGLLPFVARFLAGEHAALTEEACDQDAAHQVGEPALVAEALVKVAALASPSGPALAFGRGVLESRVRALLRLSLAQQIPLRLPLLIVAAAGLATTLLLVVSQSAAVHHAVETLLHGLL
ncbi:MAG: peptidase BlaR1 [Myxococcaceae bacterium]|nr:peptidase BlaR1 [Myxococcaceae bacterium]